MCARRNRYKKGGANTLKNRVIALEICIKTVHILNL